MLNTDKELKLYYSIAEDFSQDNGEGDTSVSKGGCGNDWSDLSSGEGERSDASRCPSTVEG